MKVGYLYGLMLLTSSAAVAAPNYTVVFLNTPGYQNTWAYGLSSSQQGGVGTIGGVERGLLWNGTANSAVDMTPVGYSSSAIDHGMADSQAVGRAVIGGETHAMLWNGTPQSAVDLNPAGFTRSYATATNGTQQVGFAGPSASSHAMLWNGTAASAVDLNPAGYAISEAYAIAGGQQFGYGKVSGGRYHALMWSGSSGSVVDLHDPSRFLETRIFATDGVHQVGIGETTSPGTVPVIWSGTAASAMVGGFPGEFGGASDVAGDFVVGSGQALGGFSKAYLWNLSTGGPTLNLHQYLPANATSSAAYNVDIYGNVTGYASIDGNAVAVMWVVPEPALGALVLPLLLLAGRRRV